MVSRHLLISSVMTINNIQDIRIFINSRFLQKNKQTLAKGATVRHK